jgi:hypothetical protein
MVELTGFEPAISDVDADVVTVTTTAPSCPDINKNPATSKKDVGEFRDIRMSS